MLERRTVLKSFAGAALAFGLYAAAGSPVRAERGSHNSGNDGGHEGDQGGHNGDQGHNDNGHDDNGHNNTGNDDGGDDADTANEAAGNPSKKNTSVSLNQDEALRELEAGRIIPLEKALKIVDARLSGKVIDVRLTKIFGKPQYRIKVRRNNGAISTVRLDARSGSFVGILGF